MNWHFEALASRYWAAYWREIALVKTARGEVAKSTHLARAAVYKDVHDSIRRILEGKETVLCTGTNV